MANKILSRFFPERSFSLQLKVIVFLMSLLLYALLALLHRAAILPHAEGRLVLYIFFVLIFTDTFFCGFVPGMVFAMLSSIIAISVLIPEKTSFLQVTATELEVFPFIAMYFLVAITVDWFRENIERLKEQIEENKRLHEQTRHMEKLVLAGEIAAGIAHEIRNPLTVVQGYLQLMDSRCKNQCNSPESYRLILDELRRANQIISEFLRFSRPDQPNKERVQLNDLIESTVTLVYGEGLCKGVRIFFSPAPDLPLLYLDRGQMIQVFLNLFSNAIAAMPEGGTISVYTESNENDVTVKIIDSGTGMPAETAEKIFIPFYTTKSEGTGLGLPISQTIIFAHRGTIAVETAPGEGTEFTVTFPLHSTEINNGATQ
ncbi:MAG: ATP-binding protein [Bacillota bacterium]|nr:ATP-binding protein [Bacillota bacterium]MDW7683468.1 ATP-binding protein [Bacillota bacterium]